MAYKYMIRSTDNSGYRRIMGKEFESKSEAKEYVKKLTSKGKVNDFGIRLTSFRQGISGTGINNPRVVKIKVFR